MAGEANQFCRWIILHHQYVLLMGLPCNIFILIKQFSRSLSTIEDYNSLTVSETDDAFRNFCMLLRFEFPRVMYWFAYQFDWSFRALWLAPGRRVVNIKVFMCHSSQFLITFLYGVLGKLRKLKIFLVTICGTVWDFIYCFCPCTQSLWNNFFSQQAMLLMQI